jgi:hypothetical protein
LQDTFRLPSDLFGRHTFLLEDFQAYALVVPDQAQEQVFRADVVVTHALGFVYCIFEDLLGAG